LFDIFCLKGFALHAIEKISAASDAKGPEPENQNRRRYRCRKPEIILTANASNPVSLYALCLVPEIPTKRGV
jgi:hypothetical protein